MNRGHWHAQYRDSRGLRSCAHGVRSGTLKTRQLVVALVVTMAWSTVPAFAQTLERSAATPAAQPAAAGDSAARAVEAPPEQREAKNANARSANNALYAELAGASFIYSISYDRRFEDMSLRVGIMYISVPGASKASSDVAASESASWVGIPLSLTYLGIGSREHSFEVGGGITLLSFEGSHGPLGIDSSDSGAVVLGHAILGYRYQPLDTGFFLRAGSTPVFGSGVVLPWPHLGLGATF